jgi:hypothetical protein
VISDILIYIYIRIDLSAYVLCTYFSSSGDDLPEKKLAIANKLQNRILRVLRALVRIRVYRPCRCFTARYNFSIALSFNRDF